MLRTQYGNNSRLTTSGLQAGPFLPSAYPAELRARRGFFCCITSIPGAPEVTIETLPGSTLPDELRAAGHDVQPADPAEGQRILPTAITEMVVTEGSTVPIRMTHAGIVRVERYGFMMP
jgi:hypothetical protein